MPIPPGLCDGEVEVRDVSADGGGGEREAASATTHQQHLQLWVEGREGAWLDGW